MDKVPMLWNGSAAGELTVEREPLYTCFSVRCRLPEEGLWCAWATGEHGTLRLGVLEPEQGHFVIRRRCSNQSIRNIGAVLRGEVRPVSCEEPAWERVTEPDRQIGDPWLRKQAAGAREVWMRMDGERTYLAFPYDKGNPFPVPALFCFAKIQMIQNRPYAVFAFDRKHRPVFS